MRCARERKKSTEPQGVEVKSRIAMPPWDHRVYEGNLHSKAEVTRITSCNYKVDAKSSMNYTTKYIETSDIFI